MSNIIPILAQIDTRILIVLAVIAVVAFIVSIIKKAVKAGVVLLCAAVLFGAGVPAVQSIKENYGIKYDKVSETIYCKAAGSSFEISLKELKAAKKHSIVFEQGTTETKMNLYYERKDGTVVSEKGSNAIRMPNFMAEMLRKALDSAGLKYKVEQHTGVLG